MFNLRHLKNCRAYQIICPYQVLAGLGLNRGWFRYYCIFKCFPSNSSNDSGDAFPYIFMHFINFKYI